MDESEEGNRLIASIHNALGDHDVNFGDDLDGVLTWINPNDPDSNHQLRPPILRIKKAVKTLFNFKDVDDTFFELLRQFLIYQTRRHFFANFEALLNFKDVQKLEKYYEFPLNFVVVFSASEWLDEINGLRGYLVFSHPIFKQNVMLRLKQLLIEDDFEMARKVYEWLCQAEGRPLTTLLIDIILVKVQMYAAAQMGAVWTKRFVIVETFNSFISSYWGPLSEMLQCAEDDHAVTQEIYQCFEHEFIRIRTQQVFEVFVTEYPVSKPTLLELRSVLKTPSRYTKLITELLYHFEAKMLKPSVTTAEIVLSYVKAIKSILTVDVSFRYFRLLTEFVRPFLSERRDTVVTFLYALLGLGSSESKGTSQNSEHTRIAAQLAEELMDSHKPIMNSTLEGGIQMLPERSPVLNAYEPICQQVFNYYLHWTPEPMDSIQASSDDALMSKSLFDIVVDLFESKDVIITAFITLYTKKLLDLKGYKLEQNWAKSLKLLKQKFNLKKLPGSQEISNVSNIDVMLRDIKHSEMLCSDLHSWASLNPTIFPKIISYLFWGTSQEFCMPSKNLRLPLALEQDLERYREAYSDIKKGRKLKVHQEQSIVEVNLTFEDKRTVKFEVPLKRAVVLSCFSEHEESKGLTQTQIIERTGASEDEVVQALQFWRNASVLYHDEQLGVYKPVEHLESEKTKALTDTEDSESIATGKNSEFHLSVDSQQREITDAMEKVWPFIKGMLTNLGTMKVDKIHSFLKIAVPKEIGFVATVSQLEVYLNILVDEGKLVSNANGTFKLVK
ncbi:anaphase promoting complex subunit 2 LALA0_S07e04984g [Lachancea lanzarotensis]|uniref:Anaphase-promoting complex subunit 2 n=1 Tax=Lachancea lanzarotensis TaxID=1245769 RepID=A0A0C7MZJ1_9SACH|nr:uncharacterized protein LALA0_S07e04984g [Lachancea lanzarotensis]CEP63212.1 LALA0S07e04984g1_1 [Lachancea lanzarotensis]